MTTSVSGLRRWFALGAILMIAIVAGMYLYARWRVRSAVHEIHAKIGLDIQQTAEGFSISKSVEGRTQFTVSASKAVQFKDGGRAELHDVKIIVYGADASRFDRPGAALANKKTNSRGDRRSCLQQEHRGRFCEREGAVRNAGSIGFGDGSGICLQDGRDDFAIGR